MKAMMLVAAMFVQSGADVAHKVSVRCAAANIYLSAFSPASSLNLDLYDTEASRFMEQLHHEIGFQQTSERVSIELARMYSALEPADIRIYAQKCVLL